MGKRMPVSGRQSQKKSNVMSEDRNKGWEMVGGRGSERCLTFCQQASPFAITSSNHGCLSRKQQQRRMVSTLKPHIFNIHLKDKYMTDARCFNLDLDPTCLSSSAHVLWEAGPAGRFEPPPQQPRAESCSPTDDGWTLQLWFPFVSPVRWTFLPLLGFFHIPANGLIFCSLHILSFYSLSSLPCQARGRECEYLHMTIFSGNTRAYLGQNQLTQESFYRRSSYKL